MATYAEDYLIDDDISTSQFNGTLTFTAETTSSQTAIDAVETTGNILFAHYIYLTYILNLETKNVYCDYQSVLFTAGVECSL